MIIREAKREDLLSIANVQIDSNRSTYKGNMPDDYLNNLSPDQKAKEWEERLFINSNKELMYVAETSDGNIVAFASASLGRADDVFEREINSIYILKAFQRQGIGYLLIKAIISNFIEESVQSLIIWVLSENPARSFYEHLGGTIVGKRMIRRGDKELQQFAYGWHDISSIMKC